MKKIRPFLFVCMFVLLSLSLTACAGRKNGNMNGTEQNSATSSAASETGNGTGAGTGENGMNGDTASGWGGRKWHHDRRHQWRDRDYRRRAAR